MLLARARIVLGCWLGFAFLAGLVAADLEERIGAVIEQGLPSVGTVSIVNESGTHFGSAFVIDQQKGWLLTNYHVVSRARRLTFENDQTEGRVPLKLHYFDAERDLALLVAEESRSLPAGLALVPADRVARQGQVVIAMGTPEGLGQTTTLGLVSGIDRTLPDSYVKGPFLQVDAAVYQGSSGGPLLNLDGEVIGVVTRRASSGHAAFAMPASEVHAFLLASQTSDRNVGAQQGFLGAQLQPLTRSLGRYFNYAGHGVVVADTYPQSAAREAGLQPRDILLSLDDLTLTADDEEGVTAAMNAIAAAGSGPSRLRVLRDAEVLELAVDLRNQSPCDALVGPTRAKERFTHFVPGGCFQFPQGEFLRYDPPEGSAQAAFEAGHRLAALEGLMPEDLIVKVFGFDSIPAALKNMNAEPPQGPFLAQVLRSGRTRLVLFD